MRFISRPIHLNSLLSIFRYDSLIEGHDNITLTIFDGTGGDCLTEDEHITKYKLYNFSSPYTIHSMNIINQEDHNNMNNQTRIVPIAPTETCYRIQKQIPLSVVRISNHKPLHGMNKVIQVIQEVPMQLWFAMIALISSFGLIFFMSCYCRIQKESRERMKNLTVKDYNKESTTTVLRRKPQKGSLSAGTGTTTCNINDAEKKITERKKKKFEKRERVGNKNKDNSKEVKRIELDLIEKEQNKRIKMKRKTGENDVLYVVADVERDSTRSYCPDQNCDCDNSSENNEHGDHHKDRVPLDHHKQGFGKEQKEKESLNNDYNEQDNVHECAEEDITVAVSMGLDEEDEIDVSSGGSLTPPTIEEDEDVKLEFKEEEEDIYVSSEGDDSSDGSRILRPPLEWIQYFDASSGEYYYENVRTRRVTWTKPTCPVSSAEMDK